MRLVILSGPEQGKAFDLAPGNHYIGRSEENAVMLPSGQVSRRHACLTVMDNRVFLEDLGSSNGTYVGGQRLVQKVELRPGMQFTLGEFTLEVMGDGQGPGGGRPRTTIPMPPGPGMPPGMSPGMGPGGPGMPYGMPPGGPGPHGMPPGMPPGGGPGMPPGASPRPRPVSPSGGQVFPMTAGPNKGTESAFWRTYRIVEFLGWRGQVILSALVVTVIIIGLGVYPLLLKEQEAMTQEVLKRGAVLVTKLAMRNGEFIKNRQETNLDTTSFLSEPGISEAYLLSKDLTILSPVEQRGKPKANPVSRDAWTRGDLVTMEESKVIDGGQSGTYHLAVPVKVWSNDRGIYEPYGVAYIVFQAKLLAEANSSAEQKFLICTIIIGVVMVGFIVLLFMLTNRPLQALQEDSELALRGDLRTVESRARWKELVQLAQSLNRSFDRYQQALIAGPSAGATEAAGPSFQSSGPAPSDGMEEAKVEAISNAVAEGVIITDEMQRVVYLNRIGEKLFGVPLNRAKNRHIMEVIGNQDILGAVLDLMKQLLNAEDKTVSVSVPVSDGGGNRKVNIVVAGVKNSSNQLEYAAIVIR